MATFAGGLIACGDGGEDSSVYNDLWLDRTTYTFHVDETMELNVYDGQEEVADVVWSSKNPELASVDSNGKITALLAGKTEITAQVGDKQLVCKLTVKDRMVDFLSVYDNVNLDIDDTSANKDEYPRSVDLDITIDLNKVNTDLNITYASSDVSIATVQNGVITAVKKGSAVITASTVVGGKTYSKDFPVSVYPKSIDYAYDVSFIKVEDSYGAGLEFPYTATGEIDFVKYDDKKLTPAEYEISNGRILLKKSVYRQDGKTDTGRHKLYVAVVKTETESDRYCYPFVLADYVLNTVEEVKALSDEVDLGGVNGAYIVLGQDIEYPATAGGYSGRVNSGGVFNRCTIDGYGHSLVNWNVTAGWAIFGTISNSVVRDLGVVNATYGSGAWSLLFTTVTGVKFENVFISCTKTAFNNVHHSIIGLNLAGVTMQNCVILSGGAKSNFELGRVDSAGGASSLRIDGNVFMSDYVMLLDKAKNEDCIDSVNGENVVLKNGDNAGLIAALKALAAKENNFTFDETTNSLSLLGNVVYTVEVGE